MDVADYFGSFNLQATLSMTSAESSPPVTPHHPMTCRDELRYHDDGVLECEHVKVPADDRRTRACVDHSIAILILEMLREREGL